MHIRKRATESRFEEKKSEKVINEQMRKQKMVKINQVLNDYYLKEKPLYIYIIAKKKGDKPQNNSNSVNCCKLLNQAAR